MVTTGNVPSADGYTDANTLTQHGSGTLELIVANAGITISLYLPAGGGNPSTYEWAPEQFLGPSISSRTFPNVGGVRFKSAVAGVPAQVTATLFTQAEVLSSTTAPFTQQITPSGAILPPATGPTSVNLYDNGGLVAAEPGLNMVDSAAAVAGVPALTWTAVDSPSSYVSYTPVFSQLSGVLVRLADSGILAGPAASIDFQSIPATFMQLLLLWYGRSDAILVATTVRLRFNGDAGANYDDEALRWNGTAATLDSNAAGAGSILVGAMPGASATASISGQGEIRAPGYSGTTFHGSCNSDYRYGTDNTAGNQWRGIGGGKWRNTSAINRVTILPGNGNWVAGSRAVLYGL